MSKVESRVSKGGSQPLRLPNGKVIGRVEGHRFVKTVCASKHKLRTPPAWAIDAEAFDESIKPVAQEIIVWDRESETRWRVTVADFDALKGTFDRGFGKQYFLPLSHWQVIGPSGDRQLRFWGDDTND